MENYRKSPQSTAACCSDRSEQNEMTKSVYLSPLAFTELSHQMAKSLNLYPPAPFRLDYETRATAGTWWSSLFAELYVFLTASGVSYADQKRAVLLFVIWPTTREIYSTIDARANDKYADIVGKKLTNHFKEHKLWNFPILSNATTRWRAHRRVLSPSKSNGQEMRVHGNCWYQDTDH